MGELASLKGVGPKTEEKLEKMGIRTYDDLLACLPVDYVDFSAVTPLSEAPDGAYVFLEVQVLRVTKPFRKGKLTLFKVSAETPDGERVNLDFYNSAYAYGAFRDLYPMRVYGKLSRKKGDVHLVNPAFENALERKWQGIRPIYATRGAVAQATFASLVQQALQRSAPQGILEGGVTLAEGLRMAHMPQSQREIRVGRRRVLYEKLVTRIAAFRLVRDQGTRAVFYRRLALDDALAALPFSLTPTQKAGIDAITATLCSDKPLNAMVVGDVGSGKTAVALLAAYFAIANGHQAALMAPTTILAAQHAATAESWFGRLGVHPLLLTGTTGSKERKAALEGVKTGRARLIIGTHAVFSQGVEYNDLGLAIIDEQHRFGVAQRTALLMKGNTVDTLTLSATPIPRSLRLTAFGDVDVIEIAPRVERSNVTTAVVGKNKRKQMFDYIAQQCREGRQAFLICPSVVDVEGEESVDSANALYRSLCRVYPDVSFGLLHGQMRAQDKETVLEAFRSGRVSALIATTVVEVGIDVPNATLMAVLSADRFGLASLHQLRGRVGRDGQRAYCFLYTEQPDENERLSALVREKEGMKIAECDYQLRGGGDWLGLSQSGKGDFVSLEMIEEARALAQNVDLVRHAELLSDYARRLSLERVSLN